MSAEEFFQNQEYSYLNKFTKYDMVSFAEKYHDSVKKKLAISFIKWILEQPQDTLKTVIELVDKFLNQNNGNTIQNQETLPENQG